LASLLPAGLKKTPDFDTALAKEISDMLIRTNADQQKISLALGHDPRWLQEKLKRGSAFGVNEFVSLMSHIDTNHRRANMNKSYIRRLLGLTKPLFHFKSQCPTVFHMINHAFYDRSLCELCKKANVSQSSLSMLIHGKRDMPLRHLAALINAAKPLGQQANIILNDYLFSEKDTVFSHS
jgi:transcriptional regulator with XRE-family HTH domain